MFGQICSVRGTFCLGGPLCMHSAGSGVSASRHGAEGMLLFFFIFIFCFAMDGWKTLLDLMGA